MIDLKTHKVIRLSKVPWHLPDGRSGRRLNPATPYRWAQHGVQAADGTRVFLAKIRIGGTFFTSIEALQTFCDQLSGRDEVSKSGLQSPNQTDAADRAARDCEKLGL